MDRILEEDLRVPKKQRHTAKHIFERLRDEYGFDGQYTIVKDYVREHRRQTEEMFVPLSHPQGHGQCDRGEALLSSTAWSRRTTASSSTCPTATAALCRPSWTATSRRSPSWVESAERSLRQYQAGGGENPGRRPATAPPRLHRAPVPLPVRGPVRTSRQGQ